MSRVEVTDNAKPFDRNELELIASALDHDWWSHMADMNFGAAHDIKAVLTRVKEKIDNE
jgi:hypothetical protein